MTATRPYLLLLLEALLVGMVALAPGCASGPQIPDAPREKLVEVPVRCVEPKDVPPRPALRTQDDLMAMDRYRRTLAAWSDLVKLWAYAAELEAIAQGCSRLPPPARAPPA